MNTGQNWYEDDRPEETDRQEDAQAAGARRLSRARLADDVGAATAEYAITVLAACGFAALLVGLLRSDEARQALWSIVENALSLAG